ncbi:MAG: molybdate ABC transporter substrate-binding protein [Alphaproteobacteria bacterium HGW-Alphaproteobacteria-4]|nr:MAG: molybdate ABC transporter substrate-binding protein [Alphaproteobacteria bacterium HGW-Alphaproteobacteria-4]
MLRRTLLALFLCAGPAAADTALVAVAANYATAAETQAAAFSAASGHQITLTTGSTGKLYAQIGEGAPYDALLSADAATPARIEAEGAGVAGTRFTYAVGALALWSPDPARIGADPLAALTDPGLRHLAIANPDLAPYGVAAKQALEALGLWQTVQPRIVTGENIGQTNAMVASGAAEAGFVALSAVADDTGGSRWLVPQDLFQPIRQDAVLLAHGAGNPAARGFLDWLKTPEAQAINTRFGYAAAP